MNILEKKLKNYKNKMRNLINKNYYNRHFIIKIKNLKNQKNKEFKKVSFYLLSY